MRIYLVDKQKPIRVTFDEVMNILSSGVPPNEWTTQTIANTLNNTK